MTTQLGPGIDFAHRQLAAFAGLVGTYCLASVLAGFWLALNNRRKP